MSENTTCNVPGCDEPLGDIGVWCEEHYVEIAQPC